MSRWSFTDPGRLWLLVLVAALAVTAVVMAARRGRQRVAWSSPALWSSSSPASPGWRRWAALGLLLSGLAVAVAAYARPTRLGPQARDRSAIVITLDTSTSMLAGDVHPTRLAAAVAAAKDFLDQLPPQVDVGLVTFHSDVTLVRPPTPDHAAVARALDGLQVSGGTALGEAVATALSSLPAALRAPAVAGPPAGRIVVLSDGGSTTGRPVAQAAALARADGVPVSTIAYGTPGGVLVQAGKSYPVPVDGTLLRQLAVATGGTAYAAADAGQLAAVYGDIRARVVSETTRTELAGPVAAAAAVVLLLAAGSSLAWTGRLA